MTSRSDRRSTTSKNAQGSSADRKSRKIWLVANYRSDVDVFRVVSPIGHVMEATWPADTGPKSWDEFIHENGDRQFTERIYWAMREAGLTADDFVVEPTCRCYRCGKLLTWRDVSPDRFPILGIDGGTYRRGNIRPSCVGCNTKTGSAEGHARKAAKKANGKVRSK